MDESFSLIEGTTQELIQVQNFLKVEQPGAYFDQAVQRGFKSPYVYFTKRVDAGLIVMTGLLQLLPNNTTQAALTGFNEDDILDYISDISSVLPFAPYDYQIKALRDILTGTEKSFNKMCTGCLDGNSKIQIHFSPKKEDLNYTSVVSYRQIHGLMKKHVDLYVDSPNGLVKIVDIYKKTEPGYLITYSDNTSTKCAESHHMHFGMLKSANELVIGDVTGNKEIVSIKKLRSQEWFDFEVDHESGLYYQNGILHHNSGKSLVISLIAEFFRRKGLRGILLVPNINLLTQFYADIGEYNLSELQKSTQLIGAENSVKSVHELTKQLTISTWQSISNFTGSLQGIDYVIVDECHRFASEVTSDIVQRTGNARFKFGFTGTLPDDSIKKMTLLGLFGSLKTHIKTQELIDLGLGTPIKINTIALDYSYEEKSKLKSLNVYQKQLKYIKEHDKRNDFLTALTCKLSGNTLLLFSHTEHGKELFNRIYNKKFSISDPVSTGKTSFKYQEQYGVYFLNGEDDSKTREQTRKILETNIFVNLLLSDGSEHRVKDENYKIGDTFNGSEITGISTAGQILVSNYAILSTGVNIKNLHNMVLASPLKSYTTISQSIGRGIRLHESKETFTVYDIVDNMGYRKPSGVFWKQYKERLEKSYNSENIPVKETFINF